MNISRMFKWNTGLRKTAKAKRYRRNRKHSFYTMSNGMRIQRHVVLSYLVKNDILPIGVHSRYKIGVNKIDGSVKLFNFDDDDLFWRGRRHEREIETIYRLTDWMETNKAYVRAYEIAHNINI